MRLIAAALFSGVLGAVAAPDPSTPPIPAEGAAGVRIVALCSPSDPGPPWGPPLRLVVRWRDLATGREYMADPLTRAVTSVPAAPSDPGPLELTPGP